ncbi:hypothetical protein [Cohnella sp. REN36]|uniref:hypothetical protein n=1 Tax=Cohnella sp. REN36 TaxID=2887347 RepID=UPI001D153DB6|nr:hypothetical protein [Cohnella sp. REN36]MCC3374659.1 hypothetical protein [Cohnella sp. REN36]
MKHRKLRRIGGAIAVLLLAVLVGCQAVGGLNLNDMIVNQLNVKSSESRGTVEVTFDWDEEQLAAADPEAVQAIDWFRKVSLQIDAMKSDDRGHAYAKGAIALAKGTIPFELRADPEKAVLNVGGAAHPFVLDLTGAGGGLPGLNGLGVQGKGQNEALQEAVRSLVREAASYVVGHLPNPPVVRVEAASLPIDGVQTDLTKVHAELNGKEIGELVPVFLDSLAKDEQGLRELIRTVVQWGNDLPADVKLALGIGNDEAQPTEAEIDEVVQEALAYFKETQAQIEEAKRDPDWEQAFNDGMTLKTDLYVDKSLHIRKSDTEWKIDLTRFGELGFPLKSVTITSSQESWNVNGDVGLGPVAVPADAITAEQLVGMTPYRVVKQFSVDSAVYGLLKNDLHFDDQSFTLSDEWGVPFASDEDGGLYVPLRETLRQLDIPLSYDPATKVLRFYDEPTMQDVTLKAGSANVSVNGTDRRWTQPLVPLDGVLYAYADDLLGLLRAEYRLQDGPYGDQELLITRKP